MRDIVMIEELIGDTFKILNGLPQYITIEQKENAEKDTLLEEKIISVIQICSEWNLDRIGAVISRGVVGFNDLKGILQRNGFQHFSSKVEVFKDLVEINEDHTHYEWHSLEDSLLTEEQFKAYWRQCMLYSDNQPSSLSMGQHLDSIKSELGKGWQKSCRVFFKKNKPLGITIPHIEPGTHDEGRLFYFGILPEERGNGLSHILHYQSLLFLKEMGATYYIGATHITNKKMRRVFEKNGCMTKSYSESFYKILLGKEDTNHL